MTESPFLMDVPTGVFSGKSGYTGVHKYRLSSHRKFWEQYSPLFSKVGRYSELNRAYKRWYLDGRFQFRIDETLRILEQDQGNHRANLSFVLPGGGVKSLYQAVIIDKLYNDCQLQNIAFCGGPCAKEKPLKVNNVIGTSGGAMVGMLVAHQTANLEKVFRDAVGEDVFPFWDFPRWGSLIVLGIIFSIVLAFFRMPRRSPFHLTLASGEVSRVPGSVATFVIALFVLTPIAVRYMHIEESGSIPIAEGVLYVVLGFLCHFTLTCIGRRKTPAKGQKGVADFHGDIGRSSRR